MKHYIKIIDIHTKETIKIKKFHTKCEKMEFWNDYQIDNNFLINEEWFTIVLKEDGSELIYYVDKGIRL